MKRVSEVDRNSTHLQVGIITRPHGVRGELKVRLHNEDSTSLPQVTHLVVEDTKGVATRYEIESLRGSNKGPILALAGVHGMEAADALRGAKIWIERTAIEALSPGEYYLVDLIGCTVRFEGKPFARVTEVRADPSVDTMVLALEAGGVSELAIVDAWVGEVSIENRTVELLSLDGLIES
jgi:16S rRNA processing protein RimM